LKNNRAAYLAVSIGNQTFALCIDARKLADMSVKNDAYGG